MPLGPGGLDSNGIWLYGEDDSEALASDLLNLGMQSVSDALSGVGGILEVVSTTKTDTFSGSLATNTFADITGLSVSITPKSTSSTMLILVSMAISYSGEASAAMRLMRDSTAIGIADAASNRPRLTGGTLSSASAGSNIGHVTANFLDSPATTSAITYKPQVYNYTGGTTNVRVNRSNDDTDAFFGFRTVSTITVLEVAG
jgi:hypothetical protein